MKKTMMRMALAATIFAATVSVASADFFFDYSSLNMTYTLTNGGATAGQVIGTITVTDITDSGALARDESNGNTTRAEPDTAFNFSFTGDVIKGAAANQYSIVSTGGHLAATDSTLVNKLEGRFSSSSVSIDTIAAEFRFAGLLGSLPANDAILVNGVGDAWSWIGNAGAFPSIGLATGRSNFDTGTLSQFSVGTSSSSLDDFFSASRSYDTSDVKIRVVPAPAALLLGVLGMGGVHAVRRRFGRKA